MTFNNSGTFTATILDPTGMITTDAGTWALTPTSPPLPIGNAQGHLVLADNLGVFLAGDVFLLNADQLVFSTAVGSAISDFIGATQVADIVLTKMTP
jgi:hypothetical protein